MRVLIRLRVAGLSVSWRLPKFFKIYSGSHWRPDRQVYMPFQGIGGLLLDAVYLLVDADHQQDVVVSLPILSAPVEGDRLTEVRPECAVRGAHRVCPVHEGAH